LAYKGCERLSGKPNVRLYKDTSATAAYKAGELVRLDTSGTLVIATGSGASATNGILGIAMADSPASTSVYTPVDVITSDGSTFIMKNSGTTTEEDNGNELTITFTTTAQTCATSNSVPAAVQLGLWDAAAATKARVVVGFYPAVLQSEIGW
jgi:hypothetical protein